MDPTRWVRGPCGAGIRQPDAVAAGLRSPTERDHGRPARSGDRAVRGRAVEGTGREPRADPGGHGPAGGGGPGHGAPPAGRRGTVHHTRRADRVLPGPGGTGGPGRETRGAEDDRRRPGRPRGTRGSHGRTGQGGRRRGLLHRERGVSRAALRAERQFQAAGGTPSAGGRGGTIPGADPGAARQPRRVGDRASRHPGGDPAAGCRQGRRAHRRSHPGPGATAARNRRCGRRRFFCVDPDGYLGEIEEPG